MTNQNVYFIVETGENQISQLSGEVHTQVWPQIFMGLVGHLCHPVRRELHEGLQLLALCRQRGCVRRSVEDEVLQNLQLEILRNAMEELDQNDQALLALRYNDELTIEEIGKVYGISKMAVSKRLRTLHEKLRGSVR